MHFDVKSWPAQGGRPKPGRNGRSGGQGRPHSSPTAPAQSATLHAIMTTVALLIIIEVPFRHGLFFVFCSQALVEMLVS